MVDDSHGGECECAQREQDAILFLQNLALHKQLHRNQTDNARFEK